VKGAQVAVAWLRKEKLDETLHRLRQAGYSALALECDVTKAPNTAGGPVCGRRFGKVNVLVIMPERLALYG